MPLVSGYVHVETDYESDYEYYKVKSASCIPC